METKAHSDSLPPNSGNEGPIRERELDVLRQLSGEGPGFRDRIDEYMTLSGQLVSAIQEALEKKDAQALKGDANSLKGVSEQVGAYRLAADSEFIESAAAKGDMAGAQERFRSLMDDHKATVEKLQSIRTNGFP